MPGIDEERDLRDAARIAARRDGLSLGDWLDAVMSDRARSLGLDLSDLAPDQRIQAVMKGLGWAGDAPAAHPVAAEEHAAAPADDSIPPAVEDHVPPAAEHDTLPAAEHHVLSAAAPLDLAAATLHPPVETAAPPAASPDVEAEQRAAEAASRQAAQRADIQTKLTALFSALDKPRRRSEVSAIAAATAQDDEPRVRQLLGETAISPSWRLEKAIGEIAERQAFLDQPAGRDAASAPQRRRRTDMPQAPAAETSPRKAERPVRPDTVRPRRAPDAVPSIFTSLQGDIARLSQRLDAVHRDVARRTPPPAQTSFDDIRALLDEMRPDASIDTLGQHVAALSQKLDKVIDHRVTPETIGRLSQRIEEVHAELTSRLTAQAAPPAIDMAAIEQLIRDVVEHADRGSQGPDIRALEQAVTELGGKLERAERSQIDGAVIGDLQAQLGHLTERMDRGDAGLSAIVAVERSLGDIFAQMGAMRDATVEAAQSAAQSAAQETMRAAIEDGSLAARPTASASDAVVEQVSHDLANFRAAREDADKRLHVILAALNGSLERVVDRLGALEEDVAEGARQTKAPLPLAQAAPAPAPAPAPIAARPEPLPAPVPDVVGPPAAADVSPSDAPVVIATRQPVAAPAVKAATIELDVPIEPGSGASRQRAEPLATEVQLNAPDPASFIAAARRAAQNAALEQASRAETTKGRTKAPGPGLGASPASKAGRSSWRRPLLLALASLVLLMGAAQIVRISLNNAADDGVTAPESPAHDAKTSAADAPAVPTIAAAPAAAPAVSSADATAPAAATPAPVAPPAAAQAEATPQAHPLPSLAMGPAANLAAAQLAENTARSGAATTLPAGLLDLAQSGRADAQYEAGLRYADGRGVSRDMKAAASWFEKAAKQGLAPGAYRLGSLYERGIGVTRDAAEAIGWYQKAADAGNVRAMHNLAVLLAEGATGKADYAAAASWFTKAAEAGVKDSQFNLAILYARGLGLDQNLAQAYTWFSIAAAQGDADSAKKRDDVAGRLDATALAAAKKAADDFKPVTPLAAANDVPAPPGGWDAAPARSPAPAPKGARPDHVSSM